MFQTSGVDAASGLRSWRIPLLTPIYVGSNHVWLIRDRLTGNFWHQGSFRRGSVLLVDREWAESRQRCRWTATQLTLCRNTHTQANLRKECRWTATSCEWCWLRHGINLRLKMQVDCHRSVRNNGMQLTNPCSRMQVDCHRSLHLFWCVTRLISVRSADGLPQAVVLCNDYSTNESGIHLVNTNVQ